MFVQSMTGYGRCEQSFASGKYSVEIKSVNNRFMEIQCRLPRIFNPLELQIRKYLTDKLERGSVNINVNFEAASADTDIDFDEKLAAQYFGLFNRMSKKFGYKTKDMSLLMPFFRDFIVSKPKEFSMNEISEEFFEILEKAVLLLVSERKREGESTGEFLLKSLDLMSENLCKIEIYAPQRIEKYKNKLNTAVNLLKKEGIDEQRIALEVILTVEKIDITEEITRLKAHISATKNLLETEISVGKRLGFWLQEINREINTIGSKANDAAIADIVVSMKDAAEQMREQSLNLL